MVKNPKMIPSCR